METKPKKVNHSKMKLGKLPVKHDERSFRLADYLKQEKLSPVPDEWNWGHKIAPDKWGIMKNRDINNCTCVTAGHFIMSWTSNTGRLFRPRVKAIVDTYISLSGYDPLTGNNDDGIYSLDLLKYWRKNTIDGHGIMAFATVSFNDREEVKNSIYLFGGCFAGLGLPLSCVKQDRWKVEEDGLTGNGVPGSWGGHAVLITGYNADGLKCITWGKEKIMTWDFWNAYCQEAYAVMSEDFIEDSKTPTGIEIEALRKSLAALKKDLPF